MAIVALIAWVATIGVGSYMARIWVTNGGLRPAEGTASHFPAARVFTHLGLAVAGLVIWIVYLVAGSTVLAWVAFVDILLVVTVGSVLVRRWAADGRAAMSGAGGSAPAPVDLAEQHIPRPPVVLHGVLASLTVLLVLLAALGVGG